MNDDQAVCYADWTVRLNAATSDLGWALRDKKPEQAKKLLVEIMTCAARLNEMLRCSPPKI